MDRRSLLELVDLNLLETAREMTRRSRGGRILESDGLLLHSVEHPLPWIANGARRTDVRLLPDELVRRGDEFFGAPERRYSVTVATHLAEDAVLERVLMDEGFELGVELPEMVIDHPLGVPAVPAGVEVRRVEDASGVEDFVAVVGPAFGPPDAWHGLVATVFNDPRSLQAPQSYGGIAYLGGEPVAAAMTMVSHGVAFVGWVGTLEAARGRGLGELVTRAATDAGFELGAHVASLQASEMGDALYRRLGYVEISRYREYARPPG